MKRKSIRFAINELAVLPLICLGLLILVVSIPVIYGAIGSETEEGLKNLSHALLEKCNVWENGDYSLENGVMCKGGVPLGEDYYIVDSVKDVSGIDATIFWGDTRMLTTVRTENGERVVGTKASEKVVHKVLEDGEDYFSESVLVNDVSYYGYYTPIRNSDDSIVGMVFVGKSRERVVNAIFHVVFRVLIVAMVVTAVTLLVSLQYAGWMINSLSKTREFLGNAAQGRLECQIDGELIERPDEIGDMARSAQALQKSMLKLIGTDPLTGLYNRRNCTEALNHAMREYCENGKTYMVVIGDIDNFKHLNDTYGHPAGDQVLRELSEIFRSYMRKKGVAARWGGEEFLFIYNEEQGALQELEHMMEKIRGTQICYKGQKINVTMTFGAAVCKEGDTTDSLIKRAEDRLYFGKANGKNQIVSEES